MWSSIWGKKKIVQLRLLFVPVTFRRTDAPTVRRSLGYGEPPPAPNIVCVNEWSSSHRVLASLFLTHISNLPLTRNHLVTMVNLSFLPHKLFLNCLDLFMSSTTILLETASSHPGQPKVSPKCSAATLCHEPILHTSSRVMALKDKSDCVINDYNNVVVSS